MQLEEALRTIVRVIEATAQRPFGLLALLVFACATVAYLALRDGYPRASAKLVWLMFAGLAGVALAISQTLEMSPSLLNPRGAPPAAAATPLSSLPGSATADGEETFRRSAVSPTAGAGTSRPQPSTGQLPDSGGGDGSGARSRTWVADGQLADEVATRDHRCPNPLAGILSCEGNPTRTTYRIAVSAGGLQRLSGPELRCMEGPCDAAAVNFTRLSADRRTAEASFEVWGGPTRWRLTATRETSVPTR